MDEKMFELMTKMYNKMESMEVKMESMEAKMDNMETRIGNIESSMATKDDLSAAKQELTQNITRLENRVMDKVSALFDARQMQIDHETAMAKDIKQVQGTVEKIELKIIRNS